MGIVGSAASWLTSHDAIAACAAASFAGAVVVVVVLLVVEPGAVVVDEPGVVVVVLDAAGFFASGGNAASTGRKRSSAVRPTRRRALPRSFTPGRSTTMLSPWRLISGSATPSASTRLRMMSTAWSIESLLTFFPTGWSTTEMPPCRSRPRIGSLPEISVAPRARTVTRIVPAR